MEVVLDESPEAQSRFQVALPDSQLSAPGTGPQWVLSGRMNERTNDNEASTASEGMAKVSSAWTPREKAAGRSAAWRVFPAGHAEDGCRPERR